MKLLAVAYQVDPFLDSEVDAQTVAYLDLLGVVKVLIVSIVSHYSFFLSVYLDSFIAFTGIIDILFAFITYPALFCYHLVDYFQSIDGHQDV